MGGGLWLAPPPPVLTWRGRGRGWHPVDPFVLVRVVCWWVGHSPASCRVDRVGVFPLDACLHTFMTTDGSLPPIRWRLRGLGEASLPSCGRPLVPASPRPRYPAVARNPGAVPPCPGPLGDAKRWCCEWTLWSRVCGSAFTEAESSVGRAQDCMNRGEYRWSLTKCCCFFSFSSSIYFIYRCLTGLLVCMMSQSSSVWRYVYRSNHWDEAEILHGRWRGVGPWSSAVKAWW